MQFSSNSKHSIQCTNPQSETVQITGFYRKSCWVIQTSSSGAMKATQKLLLTEQFTWTHRHEGYEMWKQILRTCKQM